MVPLQRHLECIHDPPGIAMYRVVRTTTINGVDLPYYKGMGGSSSLEAFHKSLLHKIPGNLRGKNTGRELQGPGRRPFRRAAWARISFQPEHGGVIQPGQADPDIEADEVYQSDEDHPAVEPRFTSTSSETATVNPPAFEDVCSDNPLPGFQML
ncbi:uncharacterized protein LOC143736855 isoform X5 [Siphateles boraxobius]|uniref:uncharacterized protein LOC143736855 isoform X5 n=1 Tax=Siphateles boraxobius TaxID=180520 RepID=UPI0040641B62